MLLRRAERATYERALSLSMGPGDGQCMAEGGLNAAGT